MEECTGCRGNDPVTDFEERRRLRPYAARYLKGNTDGFPTDSKGRSKIRSDILDVCGYCFERIKEKGCLEKEIVKEFRNIGRILRAYCEIKDGEFWDEFYIFDIEFLEYLLKEGLKIDKNLAIELFYRSGIITSLSIFIIQYKTCIFDINIILDYNDTSVETKNLNMLMFMTNQLCSRIKEIRKIEIKDLSMLELENAIRLGYYNDQREELGKYIRELLLSKKDDKEVYEGLRETFLRLYIMQDLDISGFKDLLEDHILYDLMYHPWKIDFSKIKLDLLIGLINVDIRDNMIKYGGYDFYLRVKAAKKKNKKLGDVYIFKNILMNDDFKRRFYEDKAAKEEERKNSRSA